MDTSSLLRLYPVLLDLCLVFEEAGVHHCIVVCNCLEDLLLTGFYYVTADYHFFEDEVRLVEVKDKIQFAHVSKIPIEDLYEVMDDV